MEGAPFRTGRTEQRGKATAQPDSCDLREDFDRSTVLRVLPGRAWQPTFTEEDMLGARAAKVAVVTSAVCLSWLTSSAVASGPIGFRPPEQSPLPASFLPGAPCSGREHIQWSSAGGGKFNGSLSASMSCPGTLGIDIPLCQISIFDEAATVSIDAENSSGVPCVNNPISFGPISQDHPLRFKYLVTLTSSSIDWSPLTSFCPSLIAFTVTCVSNYHSIPPVNGGALDINFT
jgi:hypothetical protein